MPRSRPEGRRARAAARTETTGKKGPRRPPAPQPDAHVRDPDARPPRLAIVGRPNVGKSTLLNALVHSRVSIVEPTPGVTRDRVAVLATFADRTVEVVDTGGLGIVDRQGLEVEVERQIEQAVAEADLVLFLTDAREGVTPLDRRVADRLRGLPVPVLLLANKAESEGTTWALGDLEVLGHGTPLPISAKERQGLEDLEERVAALLPAGALPPRRLPPPELRLAVVGRRNAGKSSLVNGFLGQDRMIVSEIPGTTRDSVDVRFERDGREVVAIDTAGIRKEKRVQDSLEYYAQRRAERAMRRADVTALVLDVSAPISRLDRRIGAYALAHHHPVVVVANKWDKKPEGATARDFRGHVHEMLPGMRFAPVVFTQASTGVGVEAVLSAAWRLKEQSARRVPTAEVNRVIKAALDVRAPRPHHGRVGQVYYATQAEVAPPTFVLFVNDPAFFEEAWMRYLENRFRAALPFAEIPLKFVLKRRPRREDREGHPPPG